MLLWTQVSDPKKTFLTCDATCQFGGKPNHVGKCPTKCPTSCTEKNGKCTKACPAGYKACSLKLKKPFCALIGATSYAPDAYDTCKVVDAMEPHRSSKEVCTYPVVVVAPTPAAKSPSPAPKVVVTITAAPKSG